MICHSSSEAEISSGCIAGKRSTFINQLLAYLRCQPKLPMLLLMDNSAALELSKKMGVTARTAHFLRWQHYLRWLVTHKFLVISFVRSKDQVGDMFTKVVDISTLRLFCNQLYVSILTRSR